MKKLYVVDVQHTVYVMAEDDIAAQHEAVRGIRDFGDEPDCTATEVKCGPVDPEWAHAIPYGAEDGRTVSQVLGVAQNTVSHCYIGGHCHYLINRNCICRCAMCEDAKARDC